ncbi:MAG: MFS transporter [Geminicoccaceae bacterium]
MTSVVAILVLAIVIVGSNSLLLSPILPDLARDFGTEPETVALAISAYGLATALSAALFGRQIDRLGARLALIGALAVIALAMIKSAFAPHWAWLVFAQAIAGLGAGVALPATYTLATALAPKGYETRWLGRVLTGWSISLVAGIPTAALIADHLGWRSAYVLLAFLAALACIAVFLTMRGETEPHATAPQAFWSPLSVPTVKSLLLVCAAYMVAFYGVYAYLGDHLRSETGGGAGAIGLIVLGYGLGFGLGGLGDGILDRWGTRRLFPLCLAAIAAVYAVLGLLHDSIALVTAIAFAWGVANHFGLGALLVLLGEADPRRRGAILGLNSAVTYIGASLGTWSFGLIYGAVGFQPLPVIACLLLVAAACLSLRLVPVQATSAG